MATLKDAANNYIPTQTKNIADLEVVFIDQMQITEKAGTDKEGKEFKFTVGRINGEDYRVPSCVLGDLKTIIQAKPTLKSIRVIKKGTGLNTEYTVIPLE